MKLKADLLLRSSVDQKKINRAVSRLDVLQSEGKIDGYEVYYAPNEINKELLDQPYLGEPLNRYSEILNWAEQKRVELSPYFSEQRIESEYTGEEKEIVKPPTMSLAVYRDEKLHSVFPHMKKGEERGVYDGIELLDEEKWVKVEEEIVIDGEKIESTEQSECPNCGGELINGQGITECNDCDELFMSTGRMVRTR